MKKPSSAEFAAVALTSTLMVSGCTSSGNKPHPVTPNIAYVSTDNGSHYKDDAKLLNKWLKDNPSKRIVSFTGILDYRSENGSYQLVVQPGQNADESFSEVLTDRDNSDLSLPSTEIQDWVNQNIGRRILAISSIPHYSGGAEGYVICSVPADK